MRLFIAINFDKKTREKIIAVQERLRSLEQGGEAQIPQSSARAIRREKLAGANFTDEENLHLTLAFIGETAPSKLNDIKDAMDSLTVPETGLVFSNVGFFRSGADRSQLWWIGAEENPKLIDFQKELCRALEARGIRPDMKPFRPHITLVRRMNLSKWDKSELFGEPFSAEVRCISLMLSERIRGKLTYTEIYRR